MVEQRVANAYKVMEKQAEIHPVKLIHMLFERVLVHLDLAEEGIRGKNPRKRGENLGRAIAIITELQASIKSDDHSEAATFLRGLYGAILVELPKVACSDDLSVLRRTKVYLARLKQIWEETAMREEKLAAAPDNEVEGKMPQAVDFRKERSSFQPKMVAMAGGLSLSV